MYCTTPSGTRYQTGSPARTRARQSVDEIASAGISRHADPVARQPVDAERVSRPGDPHEVRELEELVDVLPRQDLREGVGTR
jgi:hypothetical protein